MPDPIPNPNPAEVKPDPTKPVDIPAELAWIPETLRTNKSLTKFKNPGEVAQAYLNLETAHGRRFEENFAENAPDEVKARVRTAMGVPAKEEEYESPAVPEGEKLDENLFSGFRKMAHKLGMPKVMAKALGEWYVGQEREKVTQWMAESARVKDEGMKALRQKWGGATDRNLAYAQQVISEFGGADVKAAMDETGAGNDHRILGWLARLGQAMAEGDLMTPNPAGTSVDEAKAKIAEIKSAAAKDRKHAYVDARHPQHKAMVEEMNRLHEIVYAEI